MSEMINDYSRAILARIDTHIQGQTKQLLDCEAARHDAIAGKVRGLTMAREVLTEALKGYNLSGGESVYQDGFVDRRQLSLIS